MPPVARLGDMSSHGGHIISASSDIIVGGQPAARLGDLHHCPLPHHGVTPIIKGSATVIGDSRPLARIGDMAACGAVIVSGAPTVMAGG